MILRDEDIRIIQTEEYNCYGCTYIGGRSENQDNLGVCKKETGELGVTVCDGMGGAVGGATASFKAVNAIIEYLKNEHPGVDGEEQVQMAIEDGNTAVYNTAKENIGLRGMGSTTTVALFTPYAAYVGHVGDSRIYQLRKNKKVYRTFDHSRVFEMVKHGMINEEQARTHPQSNIIMRALGLQPEVPSEIKMLPYKAGDRFVLCCDGVWNSMPEPELLEYLCKDASPEEVAKEIMTKVNEIGVASGGSHDNMTIIIVDLKNKSKLKKSIFAYIADVFSKLKIKK